MGQAIYYCGNCSRQLREAHFEQGKAYRVGQSVLCEDCAPEDVRAEASASRRQRRPSSPAIPTPRPRASQTAIPVSTPSKLPLIGAALGGAGVVVLIVVLMSGRSSSPPPPTPPAAPAAKKAAAPPDSSTPLGQAYAYQKQHPEDLQGQIRRFQDLAFAGDRTPAGAEAAKQVALLREREREAVKAGLAALQAEVAALGSEAYGEAFRRLAAARHRLAGAQWKLAVDKLDREIEDRAVAAYRDLKERALSAKAGGRTADVDAALARVRAWGVDRFSSDLKSELDGTAAPAAVAAAPKRTGTLDVRLDDFEQDPASWGFVGGQEFPGAKGELALDAGLRKAGQRSARLRGDFTGGGLYVGGWRVWTPEPGWDVRELRLWVKAENVSRLGVRIVDGSDQCHQKNGGVEIRPTSDWQEVVLRIRDMVGGEHWGGANDGRWHPPFRGFGINVGKNAVPEAAPKGTLWIDEVRVVLEPTP